MRFLSILILGSAMMMSEVGAKPAATPKETTDTAAANLEEVAFGDEEVNHMTPGLGIT